MNLGSPRFLWLAAVALPLLGWFLACSWRRRRTLMIQFVQARLLDRLTARVAPRREQTRLMLLFLVAASLFFALARPQWGFHWEQARQRGLDIVVAIDTSRSMLAEDLQPNRLARAKLAALDLLRLARTDRLALVAFAGTAFLQCPLTLDDQAFRQSLEALDVRIIPQGGTAVAAAIQTALDAFKDEDNYKVLVLLSDGEDHDDTAPPLAEKAAKAGMKIFTVGVGTPNGEVLRFSNEKGQLEYLKDDAGNVVKSRLNESLLQHLATTTGGFYLPLAAPKAVETLYDQGLAPLPKSELTSRLTRRYHERFAWPLGLAILLLAFESVLPRAGRERAPSASSAALGLSRSLPLLTAGILISSAAAAIASPQSALKSYRDGRFADSLQEYERLLKQQPREPRLHFNLGTAAHRAGDYTRAATAFTNSLTAPDLRLQQRSFYNLGNTLFQLGDQAQQLEHRSTLWQNSLESFEAALNLDPQDDDARNNLEFVRRRLEELKQQQEKESDQQKQSDDKDPNPEGSNEGESQPQPQGSQDSGQQEKPQPQSQESQSDQQQPPPQPDPQDQPQDNPSQPQSSPQPQQPSQESPPTNSSDGDGEPEADAADAQHSPLAPGQMTPQQARQLLDAQKDRERVMIFLPKQTNAAPAARVLKDW